MAARRRAFSKATVSAGGFTPVGQTGAVTRVLIESRDRATDRRWSTIGVSENIIDASFQALIDSITYKLLKTASAGA